MNLRKLGGSPRDFHLHRSPKIVDCWFSKRKTTEDLRGMLTYAKPRGCSIDCCCETTNFFCQMENDPCAGPLSLVLLPKVSRPEGGFAWKKKQVVLRAGGINPCSATRFRQSQCPIQWCLSSLVNPVRSKVNPNTNSRRCKVPRMHPRTEPPSPPTKIPKTQKLLWQCKDPPSLAADSLLVREASLLVVPVSPSSIFDLRTGIVQALSASAIASQGSSTAP